jgi:pimeloyl-ACP methyl ester carboxylesterase
MDMSLNTAVVTEHHLDRPGGTLAYDLRGDGPLVVASPGMGDRRQGYRFLADDLAAAGYRVATVDLRGHGGSSTGWPVHTEAAVAEDLIALAEHLTRTPGERVALVGNSYSGGAAVVAAARRPDLVAALVLSGAFVRDVPPTPVQRLAAWIVTRTPLGRATWNAYIPSLYPGAKPPDFTTELAALRANLAEPGRFAAVAAMARAGHADAQAALPAATAPALVVMGDRDPDFPDPAREAADTAAGLAGPAEVLMVDGVGHYPHTQAPQVVSPAVVAFLARHMPVG